MDEDHEAHGHDHAVSFEGTDVPPETLSALDAAHPALAEVLSLTAKFADLSTEERADAARLSERIEKEGPWVPGFHDAGDLCAVCGDPVPPLFTDRFADGHEIPYGPFVAGLPVHVACVPAFTGKYPKLSPRVLDQARRATMDDLDRPTPTMASFFRHDCVAHGSFDLFAWAEAVAASNEGRVNRTLAKDLEKCVSWVHGRVHH